MSRDRMRLAGIIAVPCPCGLDFCDGFKVVLEREVSKV